jgi:glycosyltransferase involved in cell wall biosynthesis
MSRDQITVFIPIKHYHEAYLRQAVDSVVQQTRTDWRLLLLVDDSRMSHFRQLLPAAAADSRVRFVPRQGRLLAGAYNTAMRAAETEFITVLLGDDRFAPETLQVLGEFITAHPGVDFFHSGRYFVDGDNRRISGDYLPAPAPITVERFHQGSPVKHLLCWRVALGLSCGGVDESLNNFASDDYDFPWTMFEHGAVFHAVPRPLYIVRDHRDGYRLTTHVPRSVQRRELARIFEKHGVPGDIARRRIRDATRGYLKQSLFRNRLHRWILERMGFAPHGGWREPYR